MKKSKIYEIFNFAITTGTIYMSNRGYYSFRTSAGNRVRRGRKKNQFQRQSKGAVVKGVRPLSNSSPNLRFHD